MNIAVVDDEEAIREQIGGFIKKRNPDFHISGFATGEGLLAAGKDFDIIFFDIQMEGMGGIEAVRALRQSGVDAVVIFITGIREYVFEAFDVSAFHYLLKPIEEQKFMEVLGRAAEEAGKRKGQKERQIFIRAKNQGYTLNLNSILYIESRGKKVEIHTTDMEEVIESYATMDDGNKDTEPADKCAGSHSIVRGAAAGSGILPAKRLHELLGFCKAGSDFMYYICNCIGFL